MIPTTLAALDAWSQNFSTKITAAPADHGLAVGDATTISTVVGAFHTAYGIAVALATRSKITVAAQNEAKASMMPVIRGFYSMIQADSAVTDAHKEELGIALLSGRPTPAQDPPVEVPALVLAEAGNLSHLLTIPDGPSKRPARPANTIGLAIFAAVGTAGRKLVAVVTKFPRLVQFDSADRAKSVSYTANWIGRRGGIGPESAELVIAVP